LIKVLMLALSPPGLKSYEVSLPNQTADVYTTEDTPEYSAVLEKIKKTGKKVNAGEADGVQMDI
jgi:copper chaperone